jgi:hypothetical protein
LKRGKIRELLTKFTIVNAKDSLFPIGKKVRSIVEFPGEGLGIPHVTQFLPDAKI